MRIVRRGLAAALVSIGMVLAPEASAGNLDTFVLGNDAAMMGGAVTATAKGSTAIWYNPAGLDADRFSSVDVSFNAYLLRFGGSPDFTVDESKGGTRTKLTNIDVSPVPTVLAYTRRIGRMQVGLGLFVPNRVQSFPRSLVRLPDGDRVTSIAQDGNSRFTEYYAGLSVGTAVTDRFRLGVSVFGYYGSQVDTESIYVAAQSPAAQEFVIGHQTVDRLRLGLQLVWGMQLEPAEHWQLGVTFRSPVIEAYHLTQTVKIDGIGTAEAGKSQSAVELADDTRAAAAIIHPMRVHLGVGYERGRWHAAVDGSLQAPFHGATREDDLEAVWNLRAGLLFSASRKLGIGGGVFTDRSPYEAAIALRRGSIDYYGLSLALRLGEILRVRSEDDPHEKPLVFGSTFAVSYAIGTGTLGNVELSSVDGRVRANERFDSVTAHEFVFHVGSTLSR